MSKPLSPIVTFEEEPVTIPRLVQVSVEIMDAPVIRLAEQTWKGLISIFTKWDPTPSSPNERFFRPWIQFDNVNSVEQIKNPVAVELTDDELIAKVGQRVTSVFEMRYFVAEFNFHMVPNNDFQVLSVAIVGDVSSRTTFTHVTGPRDARTKVLLPSAEYDDLDDDDESKPIAKTNCRLGNSLLRRRCVIADDGALLDKTKRVLKVSTIMDIAASFKTVSKETSSVPAVEYVFSQNKTVIDHEQFNIQRLDVHWTIVGVSLSQKLHLRFSMALPFAGLTVFSFNEKGEQLTILFTLLLTVVAQGFTGGGEKSVGMSFSAWYLFIYTRAILFLTVFIVTVNPGAFVLHALNGVAPDPNDTWSIHVMTILFVYLGVLSHAIYLEGSEKNRSGVERKEFALRAKQSHENEERRLRHLWFPSQAEKELAKQKEAAAAAKRPSSRFSRRKEAAKIEDLTPTV